MNEAKRIGLFNIAIYDAERHRLGVRRMLEKNGWEERYIGGQLAGLDDLATGQRPGTNGTVLVALPKDHSEGSVLESLVLGFVSVEFRAWNRLGQLHGLAVNPNVKRQGIASALVRRAERFVQEKMGRGVYVDTPVTNEVPRSFYQALGYKVGYVMPVYYDDGLDGVTYLKIFWSSRRW